MFFAAVSLTFACWADYLGRLGVLSKVLGLDRRQIFLWGRVGRHVTAAANVEGPRLTCGSAKEFIEFVLVGAFETKGSTVQGFLSALDSQVLVDGHGVSQSENGVLLLHVVSIASKKGACAMVFL